MHETKNRLTDLPTWGPSQAWGHLAVTVTYSLANRYPGDVDRHGEK